MKTTLNEIYKRKPCQYSFGKLLKYLGKSEPDDNPLYFTEIYLGAGQRFTLWVMGWCADEKLQTKLAVSLAEEVRYLMPDQSRNVIKAAKQFARGTASKEYMENVRDIAFKASGDNLCAAGQAADSAAGGSLVHCAEVAALAAAEAARKCAESRQSEIILNFLMEH